MVELSELSYYRYCRITVCYLIGRRSGHRNMVELSPCVELGNFRLQGLQPQYRFEDLPRMVKTEASGTSEVFGVNSGPQSYACHIPRNPPTFSGEIAQDPQKWIKILKGLANVVFYLEGTAAQWFYNNEDIINSWTQFKTDLCEVFGQKEKLTRQAEMTLKTRAQKPGETTESYIQEILSLCSRINPKMEEEEKVGHLIIFHTVFF
ncbi:K02A2.6-like [Cordylochernes scorpioides]|uniref:K02A2.6-like n=1 Tax=Cordylochernes scorpioides TaxID=51811 RepID=A0ABY6L3G8_9ARAC|nr:K02A2.6-like [Cordylochernes scorpioides]